VKIASLTSIGFKLHPSSEWAFGRVSGQFFHEYCMADNKQVFKVLWSEPTGSGGTNITGVRRAKHGESVYSSIRRFVIIRELTGHCVCLYVSHQPFSVGITTNIIEANSNIWWASYLEERSQSG
jgi:hypothetical protein